MKIFYDHQAFSLQDYGGITRIFTELVKGLDQKGVNPHLSLLYSKNKHLAEANLIPPTPFKNSFLLKRRRILYEVNEVYNIYDIRKGDFEIYHPTYYGSRLIQYAGKVPVVVTFHDMTHEKLAYKFNILKNDKVIEQKKIIAGKATHIIAVSENTKQDLIEIYGLNPEKITVIHLASSLVVESNDKNDFEFPYLLFVGNRDIYKNFIPFLKAISPLLGKNNLSLICSGRKELNEEEREILRRLKVEKFVSHQPINDIKLARLYSNATAFVFPSLYEGFGIPILEAFSCNCPCILSNTSSLPEVGGDAAIYMDPYDPDSMYNVVERVIGDIDLRNSLILKGQNKVNNFNWNNHVAKTLDVYTKFS